MTAAEALELVKGLAAANRYLVTVHARTRMVERKVTAAGLHRALTQAKSCRPGTDDAWKVSGPDQDGDDVDVVVVIEGDLVVVTLF